MSDILDESHAISAIFMCTDVFCSLTIYRITGFSKICMQSVNLNLVQRSFNISSSKDVFMHCLFILDDNNIPNSWITDVICDVLIGSLNTSDQLNEIHIVDVNNDFLPVLRRELKWRVNDQRDKQIRTDVSDEMPMNRNESSVHRDTVPCGFLTINIIRVFIHECDITKLQVDGIASVNNESLDKTTPVAKAIFDAAGPELKLEVEEIISSSGSVPVTQTIVTSPGRLSCKKVIHAVGPRLSPLEDEKSKKRALQLLRNTYANIVYAADKRGFKSLAISTDLSGKKLIF